MSESPRECPECEGDGWIVTVGHEPACLDGNGCVCSGVQEQEVCPTCGGSGTLPSPLASRETT